MKTFNVVAGIIIYKNKIMCAKRGVGYFEGLWEFPGGKIEIYESKEEALKREIYEELNYRINNFKHYLKVEKIFDSFTIILDTFLIFSDYMNIKSNVHTDIKWCKLEELLFNEWCGADLEVIKYMLEDKSFNINLLEQ
ncbi:MAG: NUDIX domain-containing protein [Bacilli bacterium]|nr:NUDIX domain-containing protein [Bacilli bacterium]